MTTRVIIFFSRDEIYKQEMTHFSLKVSITEKSHFKLMEPRTAEVLKVENINPCFIVTVH